jgi:hypothetical protein
MAVKPDTIMATHETLQDFYCRSIWKVDPKKLTMSKKFFLNKKTKEFHDLFADEIAFQKLKKMFEASC